MTRIFASLLAITVMTWLAWPNLFSSTQAGLDSVLSKTRPETADQAAAADRAEKLPAVNIPPGLWQAELARDGVQLVHTLFLRPDRTFVSTMNVRREDDKASATATGHYTVKGHVLQFFREVGPVGIFREPARYRVLLSKDNTMSIIEEEEVIVYKLTGVAPST